MSHYAYAALIPILPFLTFTVLGMFGKSVFKSYSGYIGTSSLLISAALSICVAYYYFFTDPVNGSYQTIIPFKYTWLQFSPSLSIDMGILLDPISVMMLIVVTFVSLMVHVYSLSYMKGEERFSTYYSFLSLFTFSMLGLVLSSNIFQIYIFWELVGVSSYLLIGFYFDRPSAVAASKKAFIVTRFADLGFLIGILMLSFYSGTLDIPTLIRTLTTSDSTELMNITTASWLGASALTWGLTLIFIGGAGKSAMFPLHIWLPDAMEGPTPVSALIHAATMVVAGVYLVARLFPVFSMCPVSLDIVTYVGAVSALLAAIIACTQTDIKRVLAYSTMSQIGYMMFALGVGSHADQTTGFTASMFHLFTHAFFKSLLFLCAGAIIHLVHSNEMRDMGGLRKYMPVTHITFFVGCLAIAGVPPLSGFFSKEQILFTAWETNKLIYFVALITSGLTAFYMFRLYFSIFWNRKAQLNEHHREGSFTMMTPLIILACGAALAGFIPFSHFVSGNGESINSEVSLSFSVAPVLLGLGGIFLAFVLYYKRNDRAEKIATAFSGSYKTAYHKFYIDEVYVFITKKIVFNLIAQPAAWFDRNVVDGLMNAIANIISKISGYIKGIQSGSVQNYAIYFFASILGLILIFVYWWK